MKCKLKMSAVQIEVEHGFDVVSNTWPFLNANWKICLYSSFIDRYYCVRVLLTNCLNCLHLMLRIDDTVHTVSVY